MSLTVALIFLAAVVVLGVSVLFVFHPKYEVGVLGVFGLGALAFASFTRIDSIMEDPADVYVSSRTVLMWLGIALFLAQLAFRFVKRCRAGQLARRTSKELAA